MSIQTRFVRPRKNRRSRLALLAMFATVLAAVILPTRAAAEGPEGLSEFALGVGYAHLRIGGSESALHSEDALRLEPVLSFVPLKDLPQLRLGAAVAFDTVFDNSKRVIISNENGLTVAGSSDIPLVLIEPEGRLSWRQYLGDRREWFIEPGIAGGGNFGYLHISPENGAPGPSIEEWDSNWSARAFVNIGLRVEGGVAGLQISYMRGGELNFAQNARGEVTEYYVGIFGALQF